MYFFNDHRLIFIVTPRSALCDIGNVLDGRQNCLIEYCRARNLGCPVLLAYVKKLGVTSAHGQWMIEYEVALPELKSY